MIEQNKSIKIKRSQIKMAGYNPRRITPEAREKLTKNLKTHGLMGGIVWNKHTSNLVSGHQRLTILDKEQEYKKDNPETDYDVWVTEVDLSEKEEKEQNIFFNNQSAMGFFDDDKLKEIMKDVDFSEMTGFSKKNQISLFAESELTDEEYSEIAQQVEDTSKHLAQMKKQTNNERDNNYIVLVFKNAGEKFSLLSGLGLQLDDERFINGNDFLEQLYNSYSGNE